MDRAFRMSQQRSLALGFALLLTAISSADLRAQGLDTEGAVEAIVGSDVTTSEAVATDAADRLLAALERTTEMAAAVRKSFNMNDLEIVLLSDLGAVGSLVSAAIEEQAANIDLLRTEIESSAMFYHAINSNDVMLRDVIALEFDGENATVFALNGRLTR